MEVEARVITVNGTQYIAREDAEQLLTEADNRRRLQMQDEIDTLTRQLREANSYISQLLVEREPYNPNEM